jgi:hypothetical protein
MPDFKFKTRRVARLDVKIVRPPRQAAPVDVVGQIQGITPDSQQEWWVAQWLDRRKLGYKYQYLVFPGVEDFYHIDFVVYTVPLWTMLELNGGHWHYGELGQDDRLRELKIEDAMRDVAKIPIRFLWAPDMMTHETVYAAMERIFRET